MSKKEDRALRSELERSRDSVEGTVDRLNEAPQVARVPGSSMVHLKLSSELTYCGFQRSYWLPVAFRGVGLRHCKKCFAGARA